MDVTEVDPQEVAQARDGGAMLLDVHEPDEYEEVRVPGVKLIPMGDIAERIDEIPNDSRVYVICAVGARSKKVAEYLLRQDFDAVNMAGGMRAWIEAGLPVASGPDDQPES